MSFVIIHVIETLGRGGAETLLTIVLPELKRRGHDVSVFVLKPPFDLKPQLEAAGIPVHVLPPHRKWNVVAGARNIASKAEELDCDIIHAHLYFPTVYTALSRLRGMTRARTCVTFHNLAYAPGANKAGVGLWARRQLLARLVPPGFDYKLAISGPVASHYQDALRLADTSISVLHNPVDLNAVDRVSSALSGGDTDNRSSVHLVLPGRLVHEKGHCDFLDALCSLRTAGLPFKATLAGDGPMRGEIEARITANRLEDRTSITGWLTHRELLTTVATADIVVIPSRFEGFGLTALEAMSLSKPVIASKAGGLPELMGDTGRLVPIGDKGALTDAILEIADDPVLRGAMGRAARSRAEAHFSLPTIASELIEIYESLTSEH
ncbi:glycosyltransferase family 4 protein [Henriciella barbarensis]|uniref:glycosyltransferase family 4 protein n=1 Tax=Henriciella barbarensis TaxID=86342 RepID=UPI0015F802CD|nr:glycosyltransferase family 4 protein [Henriciella barbarensis]